MAISVYCARCARTISGSEMEDGLVVETERGFFCAECARYVKGASPPKPSGAFAESSADRGAAEAVEQTTTAPEEAGDTAPESEEAPPSAQASEEQAADEPLVLLREVRSELKSISRAILYEKASIWNLLGGIGQIFALALLLAAVIMWSAASTTLLLAAILVQLMTLTCFLRGK